MLKPNHTVYYLQKLDLLLPHHSGNVRRIIRGFRLPDSLLFNRHINFRAKIEATFVEALGGMRKLVNTAYLVFVALDENQRPAEVPKLMLENEQERDEFENGRRRQALRKERRNQGY